MPETPSASPAGATSQVLEGIMTGSSQEQLAGTFLDLALQLSGAEFGWVGLLNARRRLDTIAMSGGAWDECEMGEAGLGKLQNMPLRGLWSTVLESSSAQIINDPDTHPSRVGVPLGHVPIRCFMGLPLRNDDTIIGMVALANRAGGFDPVHAHTLQPLLDALALGLHHLSTEAELGLQAAVFEALPDGVAVCDSNGVVTHVNPAFLAMWSRNREEDVVGWPLLDIVRLELEGAVDCFHLPMQGIPWRGEALAYPDDQDHIPLEVISTPIENRAGTPVAVCVTLRDVTEWKSHEERMWAATQDLSRSNEDLERFATLAARELHTPLRKVLAYGEFLETDCGHQLDKLGQEYLGRILGSARHQQQLVDGLLRYARIRCNEASFTKVKLGQLVRDVVSDLRPLIREVEGSVQIGATVPLRCDEPLIRMALGKLMDNGLRFHRPGQRPEVRISAETNGEWCTILVEDNGAGFDEAELHRMFQVFGRLPGTTVQSGAGLGLPMAQRIVEQHGGTITASSTPGRGSLFTISLPHRLSREPFVAPALRTDTFEPDEGQG